MKNTLIDAGPMIALFDSKDKYHLETTTFLQTFNGGLVTSWPVLAEVCHMLSFSVAAQLDFLRWCERGAVRIEDIQEVEVKRIITLTEKYSNVPMDLADATLVVLAERLGISEVISIDNDYYIYRTMKKEMLRNILEVSR